MFDMNELNVETAENVETVENTENPAAESKKVSGKIGYSSDYYQWEMANAIESGNQVAYDYAKRDYAEAKAREEASEIYY